MIGYKKAQNNYIVKLEILGMTNEDRKSVRDPVHAKYRTSKAKVVSITHALDESQETESINGLYDPNFIYTKGETIETKFDDDKEEICAPGIHYFKTRQQAVYWELDCKFSKYTGEYIEYFDNGKVAQKCFFKNGKREGEYIEYFDNGEVCVKCFFKNGKIEGESISYYSNGEVAAKCFYKNGEKEGESNIYYKNGEVMEKSFYKYGKLEGEYITYHSNGEVMEKSFYKYGKLDGEYITYRDNGKVTSKSFFKNGKLESISNIYYGANEVT